MISEQQDLFAHLIPQPRDLERLRQVQAGLPPNLHLGTTSWTNPDWEGLIYPPGTPSQDYLEHYAKAFGAVEIDSTWYRIPSAKAVEGWQRRVPEHFHFAVKVPRLITHERNLVDCQGEMEEFLGIMRPLGSRLGPLLLQFEYIARGRDAGEHETGEQFRRRLAAFLPHLPTDQLRFTLEVRNAKWVRPELLELLRDHRVALALTSYYTMPDLAALRARLDPVSADFLYLRFLGDRKGMDEHVNEQIQSGRKQRHWDELVWDRREETGRWVAELKALLTQRPDLETYVFFNNHYAGYAPGSLELFAQAWAAGT
ncbi:MAG: DUF72 domain-containing protein [Candidatus Handelsmanbacteria bacterium]|nr:DUF72 domain-containing protein [Candidatus Handelsmanbacteria bacterium]